MIFCDDCGEVHDYEYGDRVRLVQNHLLTGQVIGERNWGQEYLVRLGATITSAWFERVELDPDEDFTPPAKTAPDEGGEDPENDNVVHVDFKRAGGLH